jgi:hypothetical protein
MSSSLVASVLAAKQAALGAFWTALSLPGSPPTLVDTYGYMSAEIDTIAMYWPSGVKEDSAGYTFLDTDKYVGHNCTTGASNLVDTLPLAVNNKGRRVFSRKVDSGAGTLTPTRQGSDLLDGVASVTLYSQYDYAVFESDGLVWHVVDLKSHGSNANGRFMFFADGTLIQYGNTSGIKTLTAIGAWYYSTSSAWYISYPLSFVDVNVTVNANIYLGVNNYPGFASCVPGQSSFGLGQMWPYNYGTNTRYVDWTAVGRWR